MHINMHCIDGMHMPLMRAILIYMIVLQTLKQHGFQRNFNMKQFYITI